MESIQEIDLLPGFHVVEHSLTSTTLEIPGNWRIQVLRTGPYMYETLDDDPDLKDPGPYTIKLHLMKEVDPPGVIVEHVYEPPRDDDGNIYCPDEADHPKAYAYYHAWKLHDRRRQEALNRLASRRKDLALVNCVKVLEGPFDVDDDDEWLDDLLAFVDMPEDASSKYLLFLKTQVITSESVRDVIAFLWNVEEVTVEGLKRAFDMFRRSILWNSPIRIV